NGIPIEWIDHVYHFGIWWLNHTYKGDQMHQSLYNDLDDCWLHYLAMNGEPPVILEWDSWHEPTNEDLAHFYYFDNKQSQQDTTPHQSHHSWLCMGVSPSFHLLNLQQYPPNVDSIIHSDCLLVPTTTNNKPHPPSPTLNFNVPMDEANASDAHEPEENNAGWKCPTWRPMSQCQPSPDMIQGTPVLKLRVQPSPV
ncbi:hypothetical protein P691DRAFT_685997, partial [Macrolepiota fuliginosa MF-IS2]